MKAKKIFEKFTEDSDPIKDMNIGRIHQINKDLEAEGIAKEHVKITDDFELYWAGNNWYKPTEFVKLQLKYLSPEKREFAKNIVDLAQGSLPAGKVHQLLKEYISKALDDGLEKSDIEALLKEFGDERVLKRSPIILAQLTRDEDEKDYEEMVNIYAFIGYTEKTPVTIKGKQYYEDRLQAESMIKIDKYNMVDLQSIGMMKLRAKVQYGGDGNVYMVHVPKTMMNKNRYDEIPEEHREFIEKHTSRI